MLVGMSGAARDSGAQPVPFIRRVRVRNFRSIAECDVTLGPLTVLLGFNASGKSNFLDAIHFAADALAWGSGRAVANRGSLETLFHRSVDRTAESFEIRLDFNVHLPDAATSYVVEYGFTIGPDPTGEAPALMLNETGEARNPDGSRFPIEFPLSGPQATATAALQRSRFYELDSTALRALDESPSKQPALGPAGEHLGPTLGALAARDPSGKERLDGYLAALVPGALSIDERHEGRYSTVQARFAAGESDEVFLRESLSEGTLRAAGVLTALFQPQAFSGRIPLVVLEEPETALHPSGVGALYEALDDASKRTQVIVTSQSSDLLDNEYVQLSQVRAVAQIDGATRIGEVDAAGQAIVEKGLMTISELHRSGQMLPAYEHRER